MSANFCTVSSFSGNDIVKHFCVTVSYQRITSIAAFLAVSKHLKISESSFRPPHPLASMITCCLSSGITHSQETKNQNKQQFHLLVFSDDRLISKETEKQNEVCNKGK